MTNDYTRGVLARADELHRLEAAAAALPQGGVVLLRAGWAAALAALLMMIPSISAAQMLL